MALFDLSTLVLLALSYVGTAEASMSGFPTTTPSNFSSACAALRNTFESPNVTVNFAEFVPAGTNLTLTQDYHLDTCTEPSQVVYNDLCRVAMYVSTSNISGITLEAWLPANWTGRFLGTGTSGLSGCIQYEDLSYGALNGFATIGTNAGHNGTSGLAFYHNDEVVADFAYRALHTGVVVGKQITQEFYQGNYSKSYYLGCSTGGRQGLKAVQDFPLDFDGVVVGAPALAFVNLTSWSGHFYTITGSNTSESFVPTELWNVIHNEVLAQCDGIDGAVDGIIEDTLMCDFQPEALQCAPGNTANCLTSAQVETVRQIYTDYYGEDGSLIFPREQPGTEQSDAYLLYYGEPFSYTTDWFRYAIYQDPNWDPATLSVKDAAFAAQKNPFNIQTWNGDLSAFKEAGGKLIHWHGSQDQIITSENSPRYYNHVSETMGLPSSSLDDFYRFFRISGTGHCLKGPGAWQIGQTDLGAAGVTPTPQNNVLSRIVAWVENGEAPETLTGTKFVNDTVSLGVEFVRNHCKYPLRNHCIDPDNYEDPNSWECIL